MPENFNSHVFAVEQSDIKLYPVRNACQLPVRVSLELRDQIDLHSIEKITIWTDEHSFAEPAKDPALWQPATRETADHSLPFCVSAALLDGQLDLDTFSKERYLDRDILNLMNRTTIEFDPAYSSAAPQQRACRLVVADRQEQTYELERIWAPNDTARLPGEAQVAEKFKRLAITKLSKEQVNRIYHGLKSMRSSDPASTLVDLLVL